MSENSAENPHTIVYNRIKKRITITEIVVQVSMLLFFVFSPLTVSIAEYAEFHLNNRFLQFFLFSGIIGAVFYAVELIISYYSGYIIEKDFGLSNQTLAAWAKDQLKSLAVVLVIGIPVAGAFYAALLYAGPLWWFYFATVIVLLSIVLARLAPVVLFPLFYTFTPVEDESLRKTIIDQLDNSGIAVENIFSFNLSKTTKKANAAFTGLGKTKRIILSDTLHDNFTVKEIGAVFSHEMGHFLKKHVLKLMFVSIFINYVSYFICSLLYNTYLESRGLDISSLEALPMLILMLSLFSFIVMPFVNSLSRKYEWEADTYALQNTHKDDLVSAFNKLSQLNFADRNPHPLYEFLFYSHPNITSRIEYAKDFSTGNNHE